MNSDIVTFYGFQKVKVETENDKGVKTSKIEKQQVLEGAEFSNGLCVVARGPVVETYPNRRFMEKHYVEVFRDKEFEIEEFIVTSQK